MTIYKEWYSKNKEKKRLAQDKRRSIHVDKVKALKESSPCADCGKFYPHYVMDFDHAGNNKFDNIAHMLSYKWEKIQLEIDKCEIVCANCHRIRTHGELTSTIS